MRGTKIATTATSAQTTNASNKQNLELSHSKLTVSNGLRIQAKSCDKKNTVNSSHKFYFKQLHISAYTGKINYPDSTRYVSNCQVNKLNNVILFDYHLSLIYNTTVCMQGCVYDFSVTFEVQGVTTTMLRQVNCELGKGEGALPSLQSYRFH